MFIAAFKLSPAGLASVIGSIVTLSSFLGFWSLNTFELYRLNFYTWEGWKVISKKKNVLISFLEHIGILACRKKVSPLNTGFKQCWGSLFGWVTIKNIESGFIYKFFIGTNFGIEMLNCLLRDFFKWGVNSKSVWEKGMKNNKN